jgi:hypothetical protein
MTGWVALLIGLAILGGALAAMVVRIRFLATAVRGAATVTRIRESQTRSNSESDPTMVTVYHSSFRFMTSDGTAHEFEHQHGTREPSFAVGDEVAIRYSPAAPGKTAELPSLLHEFRNWFFIIVPGILGLGALLAGLGKLISR